MELQPNTLLKGGTYRIIDILGKGGFGITYLAEHTHMGRKVCIKEFFPTTFYRRDEVSQTATIKDEDNTVLCERFKQKFLKEARTISTLDNPHIVRVFDSFEEHGTAYYVMEYIEGESLQSLVSRKGVLDEAAARRYISQVADALAYIHERNTLHLDIKPSNIMVRKSDGRAILIDFGLAKHYDEDSGSQTTTTIGGHSDGYAPIEQYDTGGIQMFSPETDIYSLGATLYFLVTGERPPRARVVGNQGLPAMPSKLSTSLRTAVESAMQFSIKQRPHSVTEFITTLDGGRDTKRKSRWWLWLLLLLLIAVGGFVGYMMLGDNKPEPTPTPEPIPETVVETEPVIEEQSEESTAPTEKSEESTAPTETVVVEPTPATTFTLAKSSLTVDSSGGSHSVGYTIDHPINGASVSVSDNQSWITNLSASGGKITFKTTDNTSTESRTGTITATYNGITRQITVTQKGAEQININGHYAVDLGLSVKWATCNVGATSPEDYGNYFAWGETSTKTSYTGANSKTYKKSMGDIGGDSRYDAATANWGSGWRLPTESEFVELKDNCTWTWTTRNGVNGCEVKSKKNGNSIFLPAAGSCEGDTPHYQGSYSYYWSSTPEDNTYGAYLLYFDSRRHDPYWKLGRYFGFSVRPVAE